MQAIHTKYLPATDSNGSRIKAKCARGSIVIPFPHELTGDETHRAAVLALVTRFLDEDSAKGRRFAPRRFDGACFPKLTVDPSSARHAATRDAKG
jgi:hypothetical protein